jgi:hypothetical protein
MWKNTVQTDRPQTTIWRMRVACWIPKATNAHSEYVILTFLVQQWLHERASMLHYAYIACLVKTADEENGRADAEQRHYNINCKKPSIWQ